MGKIDAGTFSGPSGKIGNLVGSSWRGISYLKTRPSHYNDANTLKQQIARMKFKMYSTFSSACLPFIRIGFLGYSTPRMTAYNAATSYNLKNGIAGTFPNLELDYSNLKLSRGKLPVADRASVELVEQGEINFTWSTTSQMKEANAEDSAMVLAYNPVRKYAVYLLNGFSRGEGSCNLTVPETFSGESMECYLSFVNLVKLADDKSEEHISDSLYLGPVIIP